MKQTIRPLSAITGAAGSAHSLKERGTKLAATSSRIDAIVSKVFSNPDLTADQKFIKANESILKGMNLFHSQLQDAKANEEMLILANSVQLKSNQMREKPWTDKQSAMLPFVMKQLQEPGAHLGSKSDTYLQIVTALADDNLAPGRSKEIDETYSRDVLGYIEKSKANIGLIDTMERKADEFLSYDLRVGSLPDMIQRQLIPEFQED